MALDKVTVTSGFGRSQGKVWSPARWPYTYTVGNTTQNVRYFFACFPLSLSLPSFSCLFPSFPHNNNNNHHNKKKINNNTTDSYNIFWCNLTNIFCSHQTGFFKMTKTGFQNGLLKWEKESSSFFAGTKMQKINNELWCRKSRRLHTETESSNGRLTW